MHPKINLSGLVCAGAHRVLLVVQIERCHGFEGPLERGRLGSGLLLLRSRILAKLDLRESLARDLAGILKRDLADITQAFAVRVAVEPRLNDPSRGGVVGTVLSKPDAK